MAKSKSPPPRSRPQAVPSRYLNFSIALVIAIVTFVIFSSALRNEFVRWDDYDLLVDNPHYRGLGWQQLRWMFSTFHQGHYQPLSWMTLGADYLIWGMNPFGYHLTNLLLHSANAALFFFLALRLLSLAQVNSSSPAQFVLRAAAAGFAALFFSLHPLRVESVVWATERRDVLAGFFFLATILCYLRAAASSTNAADYRRWLAAACSCYALSLLAKASGIALPVVLLLLDIYPLRRLGGGTGKWFGASARRVWFEKIPFLALAAPVAIIAPLAQADAGAVASLRAHDISDRLAQSIYGLAFYLWKTILPLDLSPFYEVPRHLSLFAWPVLLSSALVVMVTIGALALRHQWPGALASWIYYGVTLLPVLGIVQSGRQLVADRYSYLACLAFAVLAAGGLYSWWRPSADLRRKKWLPLTLAPATLIITLAALTIRQGQVWRDTNALWNQVIAVTDNSAFRSPTAHHLAARFLADRGDLDAAVAHLRTSIEIDPDDFTTYSDLAVTLVKLGRIDEAIENFRHAIALNPGLSLLHFHLGNALALQGRFAEAVQHLQDALHIDPNYPQVYNSLGKIMAAQGQLDRAIDLFRRAVKIQPEYVEARRNLALVLDESGKREEAMQELREAARMTN